ncbi:Retrovirus-related Pol polyprotein from transposon 17.6, partial [Aduncisulcus paluster]
MEGMVFFATIDLKSGYHQVPMDPDSIKFTAFVVPWGQYEYNRMPFGLKNAPPYFQATMMRVLTGLIGVVCSIYIDDIIIFAKT